MYPKIFSLKIFETGPKKTILCQPQMQSRYPVVDPFELPSKLSSYLQTPGRTYTGWRPELGSPSSPSSFQRPRTGMPQEDVRCKRTLFRGQCCNFGCIWMIQHFQLYNRTTIAIFWANAWVGMVFLSWEIWQRNNFLQIVYIDRSHSETSARRLQNAMEVASRCKKTCQESLNNLVQSLLNYRWSSISEIPKAMQPEKVFSSRPLDFNHCISLLLN